MPDAHEQHPDLPHVAGAMRAEWRAEQEAAAADAAALRRHGLTLTDWFRERMHAGDRVRAELAARTFAGAVVEVGEDFLALRTDGGRVELHLAAGIAASFEVVERARAGGSRSDLRRTFRDALLARDEQNDLLVATTTQPEGIRGTLRVARDFVAVERAGGGETLVPLAHVAWVAVFSSR